MPFQGQAIESGPLEPQINHAIAVICHYRSVQILRLYNLMRGQERGEYREIIIVQPALWIEDQRIYLHLLWLSCDLYLRWLSNVLLPLAGLLCVSSCTELLPTPFPSSLPLSLYSPLSFSLCPRPFLSSLPVPFPFFCIFSSLPSARPAAQPSSLALFSLPHFIF